MIEVAKRRKPIRALDWACAGIVLFLGLMLFLPGDSLVWSPTCGPLLQRAPEFVWAILLTAVGTMRLAALVINGRMPTGSPVLRGIGATIAALVWSQFLLGAVEYSFAAEVAVPDVAYNLFLVLCEIGLCVRATLDYMRASEGNGSR